MNPWSDANYHSAGFRGSHGRSGAWLDEGAGAWAHEDLGRNRSVSTGISAPSGTCQVPGPACVLDRSRLMSPGAVESVLEGAKGAGDFEHPRRTLLCRHPLGDGAIAALSLSIGLSISRAGSQALKRGDASRRFRLSRRQVHCFREPFLRAGDLDPLSGLTTQQQRATRATGDEALVDYPGERLDAGAPQAS